MDVCCVTARKFNERTGCYRMTYGLVLSVLCGVPVIVLMASVVVPHIFLPAAIVYAVGILLILFLKWPAFAAAVNIELQVEAIVTVNIVMSGVCLIVNATTPYADETALRMIVFTGANLALIVAFVKGMWANLIFGLCYVAMADGFVTLTQNWQPYYITCLTLFSSMGVTFTLLAPVRGIFGEDDDLLSAVYFVFCFFYYAASAIGKFLVFFGDRTNFSSLQLWYYLTSLVALASIAAILVLVGLVKLVKCCCRETRNLQKELDEARAEAVAEVFYQQIN